MPRSRHAAVGLIIAGAMAACQGGNSLTVANGGTPGTGGSANPGTTGTSTGSAAAAGSTSVKPADGTTFPVVVTNFPASTPVPTPVPTPMAKVQGVEISTDSLTLNTPRDTAASPSWLDAGFPARYQLVGMVRWDNGTYTTDVNWTSDNPALVSVDIDGWVKSTSPRNTGSTKIWATARASASAKASIPVNVIDFGKVQLDVF